MHNLECFELLRSKTQANTHIVFFEPLERIDFQRSRLQIPKVCRPDQFGRFIGRIDLSSQQGIEVDFSKELMLFDLLKSRPDTYVLREDFGEQILRRVLQSGAQFELACDDILMHLVRSLAAEWCDASQQLADEHAELPDVDAVVVADAREYLGRGIDGSACVRERAVAGLEPLRRTEVYDLDISCVLNR